jgi:hypothetical protein
MFFSFLITGLLSPFSEFFLLALEEYGVQMALLSSTTVVILAVFSHLCEMFVGVKPYLLVFRYFLCLPLGDGNRLGGVLLIPASPPCEVHRLGPKEEMGPQEAGFIPHGLWTGARVGPCSNVARGPAASSRNMGGSA